MTTQNESLRYLVGSSLIDALGMVTQEIDVTNGCKQLLRLEVYILYKTIHSLSSNLGLRWVVGARFCGFGFTIGVDTSSSFSVSSLNCPKSIGILVSTPLFVYLLFL